MAFPTRCAVDDIISRVTPRQRDCLYLVHEGYRQKAIGAALGISPGMVAEHLGAARKVLGVRGGSMEAARILVRATGLPQKVGGIEFGVVSPAQFERTTSPSASEADASEPRRVDAVREVATAYEPPTQPARSSVPFPLPLLGRSANDVSPFIKLFQILVSAFALGALGMIILGIAGGLRQAFIHLFF